MHQFIETELIERAGGESERKVWESLKRAFQGRECLAFWRYPMFSNIGERRKEADILLLDRELGLIVIEVKGVRLKQITAIEGHAWSMINFYESTIRPYQQAEDGVYGFLSMLTRDSLVRNKVNARALVALPLINSEEWSSSTLSQNLSSPNSELIFQDQLSPVALLKRVTAQASLVPASRLDDEQWARLLSLMNATHVHRKESAPPSLTSTLTSPPLIKRDAIKQVRSMIHEADLQQTQIGMAIPEGVQRIRGIAGSGKTVLLCQKIAHMYLKHPDWRLAFVFFTRSLYDNIIGHIDQWLRHYSQGEVQYTQAKDRLRVYHAWGAKDQPGLFSEVCRLINEPRRTPRDTSFRQPNEALADLVRQLLEKLSHSQRALPQVFDAILIDEGQDLVVDPTTLRFQGKQSIYWLAYQLLKPVEPELPDQRRLIWAYDEAQRLDALAIPSAKEIFGEERAHLFKGQHKGGIKKSEIMRRCYRTPGPILTAAHALGMGFLREAGMLAGITNKSEWEVIGYEVEGDFRRRDSEVILHRPPKNSPNPMPTLWAQALIQFERFESLNAQLDALADQIHRDLQEHKLKASRDILVVVLATGYEAARIEREVALGLMKRDVTIYIPTALSPNTLDPKYPHEDRNRFWCEGAVTVSRVTRAKGNEAEMVYVVGLERVAQQERNHAMRNQLFVAMTRARGWLHLSGLSSSRDELAVSLFYDEVERVLASGDTFHIKTKPSVHSVEHEEMENLFPELT